MTPQQQPTSINPKSLKTQLAYRFLYTLNTLNKPTNAKTSNLGNTHQRSHRVKIAAYASMASVAGSRRAWSRAILWKIKNRCVLARTKKRVDHKITPHRHRHLGFIGRRNLKREYFDPFGNSDLEVKLRKLVPGAKTMDACGLLDETADYIKCLATQVEVMRTLVDLYSTI